MDVRRDSTDPQASLSRNEARQGSTGHNVRYVLAVGLTSVILGFVIIWIYYFAR